MFFVGFLGGKSAALWFLLSFLLSVCFGLLDTPFRSFRIMQQFRTLMSHLMLLFSIYLLGESSHNCSNTAAGQQFLHWEGVLLLTYQSTDDFQPRSNKSFFLES